MNLIPIYEQLIRLPKTKSIGLVLKWIASRFQTVLWVATDGKTQRDAFKIAFPNFKENNDEEFKFELNRNEFPSRYQDKLPEKLIITVSFELGARWVVTTVQASCNAGKLETESPHISINGTEYLKYKFGKDWGGKDYGVSPEIIKKEFDKLMYSVATAFGHELSHITEYYLTKKANLYRSNPSYHTKDKHIDLYSYFQNPAEFKTNLYTVFRLMYQWFFKRLYLKKITIQYFTDFFKIHNIKFLIVLRQKNLKRFNQAIKELWQIFKSKDKIADEDLNKEDVFIKILSDLLSNQKIEPPKKTYA